MTNKQILDLKFYSEDINEEIDVSHFFLFLLETLWLQQEEFDGKRPFGNSGWDGDLIKLFIKNDLIKGEIDEYGDINSYDQYSMNKIVFELLHEIFKK